MKENQKPRAISHKTRLHQHQSAICAPLCKGRCFKHQRFNEPFKIIAQNLCIPWKWRPQKLFRHRKKSDHKLWKRKWVFMRLQIRGQISLKNCNMSQLQSSLNQWNQRGFFSHGTICHKTQKHTEWWKCALIVMRQYYKHHRKTVLNIINNSLINCTGTNSTNFTVISSFIAQNGIRFKTREKSVFSRVSFLSYPKPGFLIFAPILKH